jgi:hypothetical protein
MYKSGLEDGFLGCVLSFEGDALCHKLLVEKFGGNAFLLDLETAPRHQSHSHYRTESVVPMI